MMNKLYLDIAGIHYELSGNRKILEIVRAGLGGFVAVAKAACYKIRIELRDDFVANPYECGRPHQIRLHEAGRCILISGVSFVGWVNLASREAEVSVPLNLSAVLLFLRFVTIMVLSGENGLIIHASSVAHSGKGYVFSGRPNAGKSTIAQLSSDKQVLCDDFSIIKKVGNQFRVFPSPFWGRIKSGGSNEHGSFPVKGIYFIHQSDEHFIRPFQTWQKKIISLHQNVLMFPALKKHCFEVFNLERDLIMQVPVLKFYFALNQSIWRCLDAA
jgi:hypothetical protein